MPSSAGITACACLLCWTNDTHSQKRQIHGTYLPTSLPKDVPPKTHAGEGKLS